MRPPAAGPPCVDGGRRALSLDGGAITGVTSGLTGDAYESMIGAAAGNTLAGEQAFCTVSCFPVSGLVTTTITLPMPSAGRAVRRAFDSMGD